MNIHKYARIANLIKQADIDWFYHSLKDVPSGIKLNPGDPYKMPGGPHVMRGWKDRFRNPGDAMMDPTENKFNWRHGGPDRLAHQARNEYINSRLGEWGRETASGGRYPGSFKVTKGPVGRRIGKGHLNHLDGAYRRIAEFGDRPAFTTAERKMLSKVVRNLPVGESTSVLGQISRDRETLRRLLKTLAKLKRH